MSKQKKGTMTMSALITFEQTKQLLRVVEDGLCKMGLSKDDAQALIGRGGEFQNAVMDDARRLSKVFPVWRTITCGIHESTQAFRESLTGQDVRISTYAADILEKTEIASEESEVQLARVTVAELGFPEGATYEQICARAKERGLQLCPAEVGPALREQYKDQPQGEWLIIAMESIADSDGDLSVFAVGHGGDDLWLHTYWSDPRSSWSPDYSFVFVLGE